MEHGYRVIPDGAAFAVEGFFQKDGAQRYVSVNGFKTEAEAKAWVHARQEEDARAETQAPAQQKAAPANRSGK